MLELFLPDVPGLLLEKSYVGDKRLLFFLSSTGPSAICPKCQVISPKVHSHYTRIVADLPWAEITVRFLLRVRRFFCHNSKCKRVTFAERLGEAIPAWARRTQSYSKQLQEIGLALGGEAGARLAKKLGLKGSGDTILKLVSQIKLPQRVTPRVLGVDDLALRKSQTYATILVDLERDCIVDLLADRESATLINWLRAHPGVEIISRDRCTGYFHQPSSNFQFYS